MKRVLLYLLAAFLLTGFVAMAAPETRAVEHVDHCVCGGSAVGAGEHSCGAIHWVPLSNGLKAANMTADKVDFGKLPSGNYYLDCDVTVTGDTNVTRNISLCLNGHSVSRAEGKLFGYLKKGCTLNICDCSGEQTEDGSWSWKGYMNGGTHTYGSVIYTHCGSAMNIYGGNFTGKGTNNGGVIIAANDGCGDLNGDGKTDDTDKHMAEPAVMNLYNGAIYGSQTATKNSTVTSYHTAVVNQYGGQLHGGLMKGAQEVAVILEGSRLIPGSYASVGAAVAKLQDGQFIRLIADRKENVTVSGTVYLDLNGHDLSGVTVEGTLCAFDTATDSYLGDCAGTLTYSGSGQVLTDCASDITGSYKRYVAIPETEGYSFHRIYVGITSMTLRPGKTGMGYRASFAGDEAVKNYLSGARAYGYELWLQEDARITRGYSADRFGGIQELTLGLNNVLSADNEMQTNYANADTQVYAAAYLRLADGQVLRSAQWSRSLREITQLADACYSDYTSTQQAALQTMYSDYEQLLLGWDLPNIHHDPANGWQDVNKSAFGKLTASNSFPGGLYRLTEDVDLGSRTLTVKEDSRVTLCLNGHRISGSERLFKVYGTFNICDCHSDAEEGTVTSSLAGSSEVYAPIAYIYPGTMNIYGGHYTATGKVVSGGVLAVGSGTLNGVSKTPGRLNMFGGTVSAGRAYSGGGLVVIWDKSTFIMYGGAMYGGSADKSGGAISVGDSCTAMLYGGQIYGCTAGVNGGGVYVTSGQSVLYMGDKLTVRDNAAGKGGNVYHNSDHPLTVNGTRITGGTANLGGGVYIPGGQVVLEGGAVIRDSENGSLYLEAGSAVDISKLAADADVHVYNMSALTLGDAYGARGLTWERSGYKTAAIGGQLVLIPESFTVPTHVEGFQVGFGRADISPVETGLPLAGYGNAAQRLSTDMGADVYDKLMATCVAVTDEAGQTVLLISADLIRPSAALLDTIFPAITAATGVPESNIFITFTHTHSVPETNSTADPAIQRYNAMLPDRFAESANLAMADRAAATMETGSFEVEGLNFTRHYQYEEDGIVKYFGDNFGTQTIDGTTRHVTEADHTMHLVKFTRDGVDILMANWRVHPHMTGGSAKTVVSADIIGTTRFYFEQLSAELALQLGEEYAMHFIYLQGAAGNINETSKLTDEKHGLNYTQYGSNLAGQMFRAIYPELAGSDAVSCLRSVQTLGTWQVNNYSYTAIADIATDEEYNHAKAASDTYNAWLAENPKATSAQKRAKCESLGYLTTFHFNNVITRHGLDATYQLPLNTFSLGEELAFFTAPGELWDTVSQEVEGASPFAMTLCIGYCQDHYNYFVYDPQNGGQMTYESYESNNYRFVAPDTINDMIAYWKQTLDKLYSNLES